MKLFGFIKKVLSSKEEKAFDSIIDDAYDEIKSKNISYWSVKPKDLETTNTLLTLPDKQKVNFILYAIKAIHEYNDGRTSYTSSDPQYLKSHLHHLYLSHLFKVKTVFDEEDARLKIAAVASIKDKFLVVKGKKRTYKIHIGSTNILMEPNDQYLCIVADRSKKDTTSQVFLPFEGDAGLSVIISKAMLLSEDDKITDPTILSQINYK